MLDRSKHSLPSDHASLKKILALDLDETLVHCDVSPFPGACAKATLSRRNQSCVIFISKRPGLDEFLEQVSEQYHIVLYTSSTEDYANIVLKTLKIERFFSQIYHREHCKINENKKFVKDLSVMQLPLQDLILIDDSLVHIQNQPNNILIVRPFFGDFVEDNELSIVAEFLVNIANQKVTGPIMQAFMDFKLRDEVDDAEELPFRIVESGIKPKFMQKMNIYIGAKTKPLLATDEDFLTNYFEERKKEISQKQTLENAKKLLTNSLKNKGTLIKLDEITSPTITSSSETIYGYTEVETPRMIFKPNISKISKKKFAVSEDY